MPLHPVQQRYLDRFFAGLIDSIKALGEGEFISQHHCPKPRGKGIRRLEAKFTYTLKDDDHVLDFRMHIDLKKGRPPYDPEGAKPVVDDDWERTYYSFDYRKRLEDATFRFDHESADSDHHVHILPDLHVIPHILATEVDPDTTNLDPRQFVEMVKQFREHKTDPVKRRTR